MNFPDIKTFTIFLGDSKTMNLKALYAEDLSPLDLSLCTEIDISLPNADGSFNHRLLSDDEVSITSPPILGMFSTAVTSEVSALLNVGELQNIDVTFTIDDNIMTVKYFQALSVFQLD